MDELKPCPFCGGEAEVIDWRWGGIGYWRVECNFIQCPTNPSTVRHRSEAEAIEAWNTRAERTCHVELRESGWGGYTRHCGACGADLDCDTRNKQNYCPNCGAKVVG